MQPMMSLDNSVLFSAPPIHQVELFDTREHFKPRFPISVPPSKMAIADTEKFATETRNLSPQLFPATITVADRVAMRNAQLKIDFLQISMHLEARWRIRMFAQLDRLLEPEDWDEDEELPNQASYSTLLRLILFVKPRRVPGLGLSNTGNLVASWSADLGHLTIECLPGDQIQWSLLITTNGTPECAAGHGTIVRIDHDLAAFEPQRWLQG